MTALYIGSSPADLSPNTVIALTRAVHDLVNLDSRNGNNTNAFTLPLTAKNRALLGFANDINSGSFIPYTKIEATLIVDGVSDSGFLVLDSVSGDFANCNFYSGNSDFFEALGDKKLNDLDLSGYDLWWSLDNAKTPNVFTSKANTSGSLFPIIELGVKDSYNVLPVDRMVINPKGLRPGIYKHSLMNTIAEFIGFVFDGIFLQDKRYLAEVLPVIKNVPKHSKEWSDGQLFEAISLTDQTFNNETTVVRFPQEISDPGSNYDDTINTYTCRSGGTYTFMVTYQIDVDGAFTTEPLSIIIGVTSIATGEFKNIATKEIPTDTGVESLIATEVELSVGDQVYVLIKTPEDSATFNGAVGKFELVYADLNIEYTQLFELSNNLPDISLKDFVKSLMHRYNLIASTSGKAVRFYTYTSVYDAPPVDWTDKLDVSVVKIDFHPDFYGQTNIIKWLPDTNNIEGYADGTIIISDETLNKEVVTLQQPFAASQDVRRLLSLKVAKIPLFEYDKDAIAAGSSVTLAPPGQIVIDTYPILLNFTATNIYKLQTVKPRIVYLDSQILTDAITYNDGIDTQTDGATAEPLTHFWADFDYNLTFADEVGSLMENYKELKFSLNKFKLVTLPFNLKATDVLGFQFDRPIVIPYGIFYVNKIDKYIPGRLTAVQLIKM